VCDAFNAMTTTRSYREAMPLADARAELARCAGSHFDPTVASALLAVAEPAAEQRGAAPPAGGVSRGNPQPAVAAREERELGGLIRVPA
jgi:HD-GYP domain-containing protein (c-di-GMP phosphodiesterase class II)